MQLHEMKMEKMDLINIQRRMLDKADDEKRNLTDKENTEYKRLDSEIDQLEKDIIAGERDTERRRKIVEKEFAANSGFKVNIDHKMEVDPEKEFRNVAECFHAIARVKADGVRDPRLDVLYEKRSMSMGVGSQGGYTLPEQFDANVRQVQSQQAIVRSRAAIIPAGTPPDAKLSFPALDQTSGSNMNGGVVITHTGEGLTMTETSMDLREVSLEPKEMTAYIVVTNKLLNNWETGGTFITRTLSSAMVGQEDYDFMRGDGINKALGFINSPAIISQGRGVANQIAFTDCTAMLSKMLMRGGAGEYIWLSSQTAIPQLTSMVDAGNHAIWVGGVAPGLQGAAGPLPSTLLGIPVVFADRLPALGTKGDFSLVNLSYYMIKDGSGPFVALSDQLLFLSNRTVFKIVWNVDAKPWLTEPLALEGSTSNTVSPFVVLT